MGRRPYRCEREGINRGAWSTEEDQILTDYIRTHGEGSWRDLPKRAGLNRCGKSCRLRWLNHLAPDIKSGAISADEEELILRLHKLLGNRWSLIAGRLPGRTDNEIKNYWNTNLSKNSSSSDQNDEREGTNSKDGRGKSSTASQKQRVDAIRTKAVKYTKIVIPCPSHFSKDTTTTNVVLSNNPGDSEYSSESSCSLTSQDQQKSCGGLQMDFDINDLFLSDIMLKSDADFQLPDVNTRCQEDQTVPCDGYSNIEDLFMGEAWSENWWDGNDFYPFQDSRIIDEDVDLNALSSYLNSSECM